MCCGRLRSRDEFTSAGTVDSIEKNYSAKLAENQDQYRTLSCRTVIILLRRHKDRYVRSLAKDDEGHLNANDLKPVYPALKKLLQV